MADTLKLQDEALRRRMAPAHSGATFTEHIHKTVPSNNDPGKVKLPSPFVVCITGGGRGLGAHTAIAYAKAGASGIVISSRTLSELEEVKRDVEAAAATPGGCKVTAQVCDVTSEASVAELARVTEREHGRVDVVFANAGYLDLTGWKPLDDGSDPEEFRKTMDVNVFGVYLTVRAFLPLLLKTEGGAKAVLATTSMSSHVARYSIAMGISKLALNRFIEFVAQEYKDRGLVAYALHPGSAPTKMSAHAPVNWSQFIADDLGLCGAMAVWLTSEKREWLSGRYVASPWDVEELEAKRTEIEEADKLKFRMVV